jgi:hypothetical protein
MVKNIILHLDENFFFKLKERKIELEEIMNKSLTWEEFIKLFFKQK